MLNANLKNKLQENKFILSIIAVIALIVTAVVFGYIHRSNIEAIDQEIDQVEEEVNNLYTEGEEFLVQGLTQKSFDSIEPKLDIETIKDEQEVRLNEVTEDFNTAKQMFETQNLVHTLITPEGVLIANTTMEDIVEAEQAIAELETIKPQLASELRVSVEEAKRQLTEIDEATKLVNAMFSDITNKVVREDVTRTEYDTAVASVSKIKQPEAKANLTTMTDIVNAYLIDKEEKAAATAKEAESNKESSNSNNNNKPQSSSNSQSSGSVRLNVPIISQLPELPTGCEITAMTMMYNYAGANVNKIDMANEMPRHGSDPNKGYVGDPYTKGGWTIYPPALMAMTEKYCGSAKNMTGVSENQLEQQLKSGKPVVVWVEMHGFSVHAITLTGYDNKYFYYNDPWTGEKDASITKDSFMYSWSTQSYRAISY